MDENEVSERGSHGGSSGQTGYRELSQTELKDILKAHQRWVDSGGREGTRANLKHANLQGVNLFQVNLQGGYLSGADLRNSTLTGATLADSYLQDADLRDAKGLLGEQLKGADVSGAKLTEAIQNFEEGLKVAEEASKNARKLSFAILLGCAYTVLTIVTTTDVRLLTNSASSPLPIIGTEIPIARFYAVAPFVLLGLYFYFHVYMQRLWEGLAKLPAVFPDGRPLDEKAYPWLLTGLVRVHLSQLREDLPPLSRLQAGVAIALAWWFIPGTLVFFWVRYLPRQHWGGTLWHIVLLVIAIWAGIMFHSLAVATLRGEKSELSLWKGISKEKTTYKRGAVAAILGIFLFLLSLGTINGVGSPDYRLGNPEFRFNDPRTWVPYVFELVGFSPFANFQEKDVSEKPPNWSGQTEQVKGALLYGNNLRHVYAYRAFLVNADLRSTDLLNAKLRRANLQKANLRKANLRKGILARAVLRDATLRYSDLREAILNNANLQGAVLKNANLQKASLKNADLQAADLRGADLRGALNITVEQLSEVESLYGAKLDPELLERGKKSYPRLLEKPKADK